MLHVTVFRRIPRSRTSTAVQQAYNGLTQLGPMLRYICTFFCFSIGAFFVIQLVPLFFSVGTFFCFPVGTFFVFQSVPFLFSSWYLFCFPVGTFFVFQLGPMPRQRCIFLVFFRVLLCFTPKIWQFRENAESATR